MSKKVLIAGLVVCGVGAALVYAKFYLTTSRNKQIAQAESQMPSLPNSSTLNPENFRIQKAYWSDQIDKLGAQQAYTEFKNDMVGINEDMQHQLAHVMGMLLYNKLGLDGLGVCDESFGYGCYHQYFLSAVADKGIGIVSVLDQACIKKFGIEGQGCQHGIGHGIYEYLNGSLDKSLAVCGSMQWQKPLFGCQSGVFMENNFPVFIDANGNKKSYRVFDPGKPYDPCPSVAARFQPSCYFAQAEWWDKATDLSYAKIGKLCDQIADTNLQKYCLKGVGSSSVSANHLNMQASIDACRSMSSSNSEMLCLAGAYWGFFDTDISYRNTASQACDVLSNNLKSECLTEGDLLHEN